MTQSTTSLAPNALGQDPILLDVGDRRLAYWRMGSGPDIVFVHGWPLHSQTYRRIAPELAKHFTCHFVDLPGTGQSPWDAATPIGFAEHATTLSEAIEFLGLERFALLAHDSGGVMARLLAAEFGDRVFGLVLSGTEIPGHRPWLVEALAVVLRAPFGAALLRSMMTSRTIRRSTLGFKGCFNDLSLLDGDFHDLFVAPLVANERAMEGQLKLVHGLDWSIVDGLEAVHRRIVAPTQLIWGEGDPFFPAKLARPMASQFGGGAEFHELSAARLFVHEEQPDQFAALTRDFLQAQLRRGSRTAASAERHASH